MTEKYPQPAPTHEERRRQRAAEMYLLLAKRLGLPVKRKHKDAARNTYGQVDLTSLLVKCFRKLGKDGRRKLWADWKLKRDNYRGRFEREDLKVWWKTWVAMNKARNIHDVRQRDANLIRVRAVEKLTDEELEAMGITAHAKAWKAQAARTEK